MKVNLCKADGNWGVTASLQETNDNLTPLAEEKQDLVGYLQRSQDGQELAD